MTESIRGLWVAIATPLDADGGVNHAALARHALNLLAQGCDGLVPFGTTGEGPMFSGAERFAAVEAMLKAGVSADRIALGTGCPAITDSMELTRGALALGLRHVLLLPPYFYRDVDAQGIEDAFAAIIDGVGDERLRATLYHIPQVSGVPVPASVLGSLRTRYGRIVAGVKDSSGDFAQFQAFRAAAPEAAVTTGTEPHIGRALAEGGAGTICGMANVVPDLVRAMFSDPDAAGPMRQACELIAGPFIPTLKSAIAARTNEPAFARVRPPLRAVDPSVGRGIVAAMDRLRRPTAA